ncbi:hypothetical protein KY289_011193 [Solanum tuberosum]|nr:hypothetical protein KY289_011193 [Solanum tuberosum]
MVVGIEFIRAETGDTYVSLLPNTDFVKQEQNKKEWITLGLLEWNKSRVTAEIPKYRKKVPKIVNPRLFSCRDRGNYYSEEFG